MRLLQSAIIGMMATGALVAQTSVTLQQGLDGFTGFQEAIFMAQDANYAKGPYYQGDQLLPIYET
jgi:hypothetical protein